jgi:cation transport ATPase
MIGLAFGGYAWLWLAILTDVGAMLIVTLNSMTILGKPNKAFVVQHHPDATE